MSCGSKVRLCGVVTLESGLGNGYYKHSVPSVHGLWPQVAPYGDSDCLPPLSQGGLSGIPSCYNNDESKADPSHEQDFLQHEWTKHGACAGAQSEQSYFSQICSLSQDPLKILQQHHASNSTIDALGNDLRQSGYAIHEIDEDEGQVMLSACAVKGADGSSTWKLAAEADFDKVCGSADPSPAPPTPPAPPVPPSPAPPAPSPAGACKSGQRGPACSQDSDCSKLEGCLRCAHSGFCTTNPGA